MRRLTPGVRVGRIGGLSLALSLAAGACASSDKATSPTTPTTPSPTGATACAGGGSVQLGSLQGARVDCSSGTTVTLAGKGASYLVVPNFASGAPLSMTARPYTISATGAGTVASVAPTANVAAAVADVVTAWRLAAAPSPPGRLQRSFDRALRARAARSLATGAWSARAGAAAAARASVSATPPAVGSLRTFHVLASIDSDQFKVVTARLQYAGTNILLYVDTLAPANGFTPTQMQQFAQTFDQVLYPIDVAAFGQPSDLDQNGALVMLLSPVVNALSPKAQCQTQGYVAGFFTGNDLAGRDTTSNGGEVFYALVPDPTGAFSCAHPVASLEDQLGATFLHELQHLINFSQHVIVHRGQDEEGWLDEGLSLVAEELGSLYYEAKYPPPSGRTSPLQLFPDSAEGYIGGLLTGSYGYLLKPDTTTLTLHSDDQLGLDWRAGDWLLMRWLGDQKGGNTFYKSLVETNRTGIPNIEAAAGEAFTSLFADFGTALYTDSIPGVPRSQIPARDRFTTRNLRRLYAALFRVAGPSTDVPVVFPIQPTPLTATAVNASLLPGGLTFYRLDTSSSASTATITFADPGGGSLPAALHPQLSIFRVQ